MHHCCQVSYQWTLYVLMSIKWLVIKKLVGNLDKTTFANLGRQHQSSLDSYFRSSPKYLQFFGDVSYYFIASILLKLVVYILKLILYTFTCLRIINSYSLNNKTTLCHLSYYLEVDTSMTKLYYVSTKYVTLRASPMAMHLHLHMQKQTQWSMLSLYRDEKLYKNYNKPCITSTHAWTLL